MYKTEVKVRATSLNVDAGDVGDNTEPRIDDNEDDKDYV